MKKNSTLAILISLSMLIGCAGGGGGDGSGKRAGGSRPNTGFRILHANIDAPPLDIVKVGDSASSGTVQFGNSSGYISSAGEPQSVSLTTAHVASELQAAVSVPLASSEVKTVLFYGNKGSIGTRTAVIEDPKQDLSDGTSAIRVIHGAVGASAVTFSVNGETVSTSNGFGDASEYVVVPSGPTTYVAKRVSDGGTITSATRTLESGKTYSVLLAGDMSYLATGVLLNDD